MHRSQTFPDLRSSRSLLILVAAVAAAASACAGGSTTPTVPTPSTTTTSSQPPTTTTTTTTTSETPPATTTGPVECPVFSAPVSTASIQGSGLTEISGLVLGRAAPQVVWVHNDSGDGAIVYGIGPDGETASIVTLQGVFALDWEDMDIGPGPGGIGSYLYVADIGDNLTFRPTVIIHRFPEPDATAAEVTVDAESVVLTYPDGPRDAEALFIDPQSEDVVIVTKQEATIYTAPVAAFEDGSAQLVRVGRLPGALGLVTAASTDSGGTWVAIRTPRRVLLWPRAQGRSIAETLAAAPCELPAPAEQQGEALGLAADGRTYVTISEGAEAAVMVSRRA